MVKTSVRIMTVTAALLSAGCTIVALERNNFGGALDAAEDRWFTANDRSTRILRNHYIHAGLVRMGSRSQYSANQRNIMANMSNNVTDRTVEMLECFANDCIHFDSLMINYEDSLFTLALHVADSNERQALVENWRKLPTELTTLSPASLVTGATVIWATAKEAVATARPLGALYRDGIVVQTLDRNGRSGDTAAPMSAAKLSRENLACVKAAMGTLSQFDRDYSKGEENCGTISSAGKKRSDLFVAIAMMQIRFCQELGASPKDQANCAGIAVGTDAAANKIFSTPLVEAAEENKVVKALHDDRTDNALSDLIDAEQAGDVAKERDSRTASPSQ